MTQLSLGSLGGIQLAPDTLEEQRGAWCSPEEYTKAAGYYDLDPFTNPRSTLRAARKCMLENGDDGFGLERRAAPGAFFINPRECFNASGDDNTWTGCNCGVCGYNVADETWRTWIQPPYSFVLEAIEHYGHTRYTALLRLDTSTLWFERLWNRSEVIMVPKRDRLEFVPPPGVKPSSNPFPHGLYYKRAEDVTPAIAELCYPWPTPRYPWRQDPLDIFGLREQEISPVA